MKVSSWTFDPLMASNALAKLLPTDEKASRRISLAVNGKDLGILTRIKEAQAEERTVSRGAEMWPLMYRSDGFISCYAWIETQDISPTCAVRVGNYPLIKLNGATMSLAATIANAVFTYGPSLVSAIASVWQEKEHGSLTVEQAEARIKDVIDFAEKQKKLDDEAVRNAIGA